MLRLVSKTATRCMIYSTFARNPNKATWGDTVYPKKYAHGFVVLCFVVVMQSFIMNSHEVFIHIHQGGFAGTGAIVRLPQCQWSKPGGYGKISQCITTTKHNKAKTVCIFLGIYCIGNPLQLTSPCRRPLSRFRFLIKYSTDPFNNYRTVSLFQWLHLFLVWLNVWCQTSSLFNVMWCHPPLLEVSVYHWQFCLIYVSPYQHTKYANTV